MSRDDAPKFRSFDHGANCWYCRHYNGGIRPTQRRCNLYNFGFKMEEYVVDHTCNSFQHIMTALL